jgi:proline iminopeptidase
VPELFVAELGSGPPIVVLHGGPDFDHWYLRPELDRLAESFRLIYYDQRGRGRSAAGVRASDVSIESELADLDALRHSLGLPRVAVLGHSWGGLLAMEYATRFPERVSHLILMNSAPASAADWALLREAVRAARSPGDLARMQHIAASPSYQDGEPGSDTEYYRIHFIPAVRDPALRELIVARLRTHFSAETVRLARAIEDRLYAATAGRTGYDLLPRLGRFRAPTLVLHGRTDVIPVDPMARIAAAIPGARFVVLADCGHFAFAEDPDAVYAQVSALLGDRPAASGNARGPGPVDTPYSCDRNQ